MKTATFIRDRDNAGGPARQKFYRLSPPIGYDFDYEKDENTKTTEFVVVSGVVAFDTGRPETYIFPANEDGDIIDWGELRGSFRGDIDFEKALTNAGYTVE